MSKFLSVDIYTVDIEPILKQGKLLAHLVAFWVKTFLSVPAGDGMKNGWSQMCLPEKAKHQLKTMLLIRILKVKK